MTVKEKFQQQISEYKSLKNEADREAFLAKIKEETDTKSREEWIESMKAIKELLLELHANVLKIPVCHKSSSL